MKSRKFTFLGCGTSVGVPMIGCDCAVCTSENPKNNRTRSSVCLEFPGGTLLVDTTPELRVQMLREKIPFAHAVMYTHYHADHLLGLDDVRLFPKRIGSELPIYCTNEVEDVIRQIFSYAFVPPRGPEFFVPQIEFRPIAHEPFEVLGQRVVPIPLIHSIFNVLGFRFDDVAYCTDVGEIPPSSMKLLEGLDVLVLDALRPGLAHPAHFSLEQALEVIEKLRPRRAYLTHMSHAMDYETLMANLPPGVEPAYDGLSFEF